MSFFEKLRWDRSLKPTKRSSAVVSMANSLAEIAYALRIITIREYGVDINDPRPTRSDLTREVFDPMYPDNSREAVREEIERLQKIEREVGVDGGKSAVRAQRAGRLDAIRLGDAHRPGEDEDLTPEERRFLHEELGISDSSSDSSSDDTPREDGA